MRPSFVASLRPVIFGDIVGQFHRCNQVSEARLQETQFQSGWYKSEFLFCSVISNRSSPKKSFEAQVIVRFCAKEVCYDGTHRLYCRQNSVQSQLITLESCRERREAKRLSEM